MTTRRCWRIDVHPTHEWQARPDWEEGGPRQTVTCTGHVITEMELTRFDAADDAAEERAIRERREM